MLRCCVSPLRLARGAFFLEARCAAAVTFAAANRWPRATAARATSTSTSATAAAAAVAPASSAPDAATAAAAASSTDSAASAAGSRAGIGGGSGGRGPVSWASLALLIAAGGGVLYYYDAVRKQKKAEALARVETYGRPALGGPWSLVDGGGRPVFSGDLHGGYALIYFGFTFCPDICPAELVKMSLVTDAVDRAAAARGAAGGRPLQPVFITVDPRRDSCEQVAAYCRDFHPRMLGLTGAPGQVARVAKAFRVYFQDVDVVDEKGEDYLVDHSIVMYLIGPNGDFLDFFVQSMTAAEIAGRITARMVAEEPPRSSWSLFGAR